MPAMAEPGQAGIVHAGLSSPSPSGTCSVGEALQPALGIAARSAAHQFLVVVQVVPGQQHRPEDLRRLDQMVQIGAAECRAGRAAALRVERPRIVGVARVAEVDRAARG